MFCRCELLPVVALRPGKILEIHTHLKELRQPCRQSVEFFWRNSNDAAGVQAISRMARHPQNLVKPDNCSASSIIGALLGAKVQHENQHRQEAQFVGSTHGVWEDK